MIGWKLSSSLVSLLLLTLFYRCMSLIMGKLVGKGFRRFAITIRQCSSAALKKPDVLDIQQHRFSVAPMMDYTDRHFRYMSRLISNEAVLYTEMETTNALVHCSDLDRRLDSDLYRFGPVVLQVGGQNPEQMRAVAELAAQRQYTQININSGCPSPVVAGAGCFGAALMRHPRIIADCCQAIIAGMKFAPTVKCRLGVDEWESYDQLADYIGIITSMGNVSHVIVHARKAILDKNFSPEDNRRIPPLNYDYVYRLAKDFPDVSFSINGGIKTYEECLTHLNDGVVGTMVGRAFVANPFYWSQVDSKLYGKADRGLSRRQLVEEYAKYAQQEEALHGARSRRPLTKPILNLFTGLRGGRLFRQYMDIALRNDKAISNQHKQEKNRKRSKSAGVRIEPKLTPVSEIILDGMLKCVPGELLDLVPGEQPSRSSLQSDEDVSSE